MTLRLGIVGAGVMGARFAAKAGSMEDFHVTAVVDHNSQRAAHIAEQFGATAFSSIDDLVEASVADVLYIGVPHDQHLAACLAAIAGGLHSLVDKPLCNTLEEAQQIADAAARAEVRVMVGFSYRYRKEWQHAAQLIADGAIGKPKLAIDVLVEAGYPTPDWYWDAEKGGGVLQLQSHHSFDRLAWVLGQNFDTVACQTNGPPGGAEEIAVVVATTEEGTIASIDMGFGRGFKAESKPSTIIQGDRGQITIDDSRVISLQTDGQTTTTDFSDDDWMQAELAAFSAFALGRGTAPSVDEGVSALSCALAAKSSASAGGAVRTVTSQT